MSVIAISRVHNIGEMAQRRGWEYGYRLIDTVDKKILDISERALSIGYTERNMQVANLEYNGAWEIIPKIGNYRQAIPEFPELEISIRGERAIPLEHKEGIPCLFALNIFDLDIMGEALCIICDSTGKDIKTVMLHRLIDSVRKDEAFVVNYNITFPGPMDKQVYWWGAEMGGRLTVDYVKHNTAREYMQRCRVLNAPMMLMCDMVDTDGVYLVKVDKRIKGDLTLPDYVEEIGNFAFEGCKELRKVVLGKDTWAMWSAAFIDAEMEELVLNEGLEYIGEEAFNEATVRKEIIIPSSVRQIEEHTFMSFRCPSIVLKSSKMDRYMMDWFAEMSQEVQVDKLTVTEDIAVKLIAYYSTSGDNWGVDWDNIKDENNKLICTRNEAVKLLSEFAETFGVHLFGGIWIIDNHKE